MELLSHKIAGVAEQIAIGMRARAVREMEARSEVVLFADGDVVVAFVGSTGIACRVELGQLRVLADPVIEPHRKQISDWHSRIGAAVVAVNMLFAIGLDHGAEFFTLNLSDG